VEPVGHPQAEQQAATRSEPPPERSHPAAAPMTGDERPGAEDIPAEITTWGQAAFPLEGSP
jgi:hypothetical protein